MSWNTPTSADVLMEFSTQEAASLRAIQGSNDQLDDILPRVVNAARGSIRAGGNQLDAEGTIPDQLAMHVIAIARWRWLISFPALKMLQTDARKDAHDKALDLLAKIAAGSPRVEAPANPVDEASVTPSPSIHGKHRRFTRRTQEGT